MSILNMVYGSGSGVEIPLEAITVFSVEGGDTQATIKWTDPNDITIGGVTHTTWAATKLVRKVGSAPTSINDGTLVVLETTRNTYSSTGYTDTGLTNGTTYYYAAFAIADNGLVTISSTTPSVTPTPLLKQIEFLMVGGGGGGGADYGGGGGAGGVIYQSNYEILSGTYPITIGTGGVSVAGDYSNVSTLPDRNGGDTTFLTFTAKGGGGGGVRNTSATNRGGKSGGSGGGGSGWGGTSSGGIATTGQGYNGGNGYNAPGVAGQGGGGGAGGAGNTPTSNIGANGGDGIINPISGSTAGVLISGSYWLAGGGGGSLGNQAQNTQGSGGKGGGGNGAANNNSNGVDGSTYGAGGGGGSYTHKGGNGGQGILIIKYETGTMTATGGTVTTSGGYTIHTFTSDGNFVIS